MYDFLAIYFKWAIKYYRKIQIAKSLNKLPRIICISFNMLMQEGIFPNSYEKTLFIKFSFSFILELISLCFKQWRFCSKYELDWLFPMKNLENTQKDAELIL